MKEQIEKTIALSYEEDANVPVIVASDSGKVAQNILEEANKYQIPVYENKNLATILGELKVGDKIPSELYELVAKILVFVGDMDDLYAKTKGYNQ